MCLREGKTIGKVMMSHRCWPQLVTGEVEVHCEALLGYLYDEEINSEDDIVGSNASSDDSIECHSIDEKDDSSSEENSVKSIISPSEESTNDDTEDLY